MDLNNYILKYAVNLKQLTKAYDALVKPRKIKHPNVMGADISDANKHLDLPKKKIGFAVNYGETKASYKAAKAAGIDPGFSVEHMSRRSISKSPFKQGTIHLRGDIGSGIANSKVFKAILGPKVTQLKHPRSKEIVGRTIGLHEAAELSHTPGKLTGKYMGHIGAKPFLHDLTIANTLTGKGSAQAKGFLRTVRRPEISGLEEQFPYLKRLNMGKRRLNRREKKHINSLFQYTTEDEIKANKDVIKANPNIQF